jgi:hypothetical protein
MVWRSDPDEHRWRGYVLLHCTRSATWQSQCVNHQRAFPFLRAFVGAVAPIQLRGGSNLYHVLIPQSERAAQGSYKLTVTLVGVPASGATPSGLEACEIYAQPMTALCAAGFVPDVVGACSRNGTLYGLAAYASDGAAADDRVRLATALVIVAVVCMHAHMCARTRARMRPRMQVGAVIILGLLLVVVVQQQRQTALSKQLREATEVRACESERTHAYVSPCLCACVSCVFVCVPACACVGLSVCVCVCVCGAMDVCCSRRPRRPRRPTPH